jgi:hypothetical protein
MNEAKVSSEKPGRRMNPTARSDCSAELRLPVFGGCGALNIIPER